MSPACSDSGVSFSCCTKTRHYYFYIQPSLSKGGNDTGRSLLLIQPVKEDIVMPCVLLYQTLLAHNRNWPLIGWFEWQREDKWENDNQTILRVHRRGRGRGEGEKENTNKVKHGQDASHGARQVLRAGEKTWHQKGNATAGNDSSRKLSNWRTAPFPLAPSTLLAFHRERRPTWRQLIDRFAGNLSSSPSIISAKCEHANMACLSAKGANL